MKILIPVLIAILSYKIKLIDDRKSENFKKFKNYLKRHPEGRSEHDLGEFDEWLDKDMQYQLMGEYDAAMKNEGRKQAILDYYRDFDDNEGSRRILIGFILINVILFIFISIGYVNVSNLLVYLIPILSVILCIVPPESNIFNNRIVNVDNSPKSKEIYENTEKKIKSEIAKIKLKEHVLGN